MRWIKKRKEESRYQPVDRGDAQELQGRKEMAAG